MTQERGGTYDEYLAQLRILHGMQTHLERVKIRVANQQRRVSTLYRQHLREIGSIEDGYEQLSEASGNADTESR